jgi:hypothetical protein
MFYPYILNIFALDLCYHGLFLPCFPLNIYALNNLRSIWVSTLLLIREVNTIKIKFSKMHGESSTL